MIVGGGLENGGGIGRMVGYVVAAWNSGGRPPMTVIDTRGPKYKRAAWPLYYAAGIVKIITAAAGRPICHIHLAGNTSTLRKIFITMLLRRLGLIYILHMHDPTYADWYAGLPRVTQRVIRSMYLRAARVIVLGKPAHAMVTDLIGVPRERVDIVPNAVSGPDDVRYDPAPHATPHILFLGQLQRRKGVHDLIDALAREDVARLDWTATFAGGGPDQPGFEAQAERAGIRDRIAFPGWLARPATQALLERVSILVLPSYAEEMAMSVLEGMAYGLCIIGTRVGGQAEVLEDGVSAVVVNPGDVDGLALALAQCINDAGLRVRIGRGARERFLQGYNIRDYPDRIEAVYRLLPGC